MPSSKSKQGRSTLNGSAAQSPSFQPPSYYAAANGIPYPRTPRLEPSTPLTTNTIGHANAAHYDRFMPVSCFPDPSSSDSFEFRETRSRISTFTTKSTTRTKRQSQITGLPEIEAQLLPSLRHTIDRMTRPPSHLAPPVTLVNEALPASQKADRRHPDENSDHDNNFSSNAHDSRALQRCRPPSSLQKQATPRTTSSDTLKTSTPKSSSLKLVTQPHRKQDTPHPEISVKKASVGTPTLRSVKSLLTRKVSTNSTNTVSSLGSCKKSILKGSPQIPKLSPAPSSSPRKHQVITASDTLSPRPPPADAHHAQQSTMPRQPSKPPRSNIPRLRARFALNPAQPQSSDSSDVEYRYGCERRDHRRLTIANIGDPSHSSSDSDSDNYMRPVTPTRPRPGVGLGLNCQFPSLRSPRPEIGVDEPFSESNDSIHTTPRSSVASSVSSESQYSTGCETRELGLAKNGMNGGLGRRASFNIVATLDQKFQRRAAQSSETSEYSGEAGVAYSASNKRRLLPRDSSDHMDVHSPALRARSQPTDNAHVSPNSTPKEYRHYMPGSLSLSPQDTSKAATPKEDPRRGNEGIGGTIARLARRSLMIATREREAFGLKPSDSEELHQQYENLRQHIPNGDRFSESSASHVIGVPDDTLSYGASYLLQSIEEKQQSLTHNARLNVDRGTPAKVEPAPDRKHYPSIPLSFPTTLPSAHSEEATPLPSVLRQLSETEQVFVANMQKCIQLYILPLRANGSKAWISGVPPHISRFLDWLEDIVHLHERLLSIFRGPSSNVLSEMIAFLPKFEIYQPYIVRLVEIAQQLRQLMEEGSDFGSFVALQDKQIRRSGWSLSKYIVEPEKRLQKYLDLFSALLELTPPQDSQFLMVFSLLRSMEMIIEVMYTVKQAEDHHRMLCSLLSRLQGSHPMTDLADRQRTLLWHGSVALRLDGERTRCNSDLPQAHKTRLLSKAVTAWDTQCGDQASFTRGLHDSISSYDTTSTYSGFSGGSRDVSPPLQFCSDASIAVYAVIFSDLALFAENSLGASSSYNLIDDIGMTRIFSIQETDSSSVFLEVIPIDSADTPPGDVAGPIKGLFVSPSPPPGTSSSQNIYQDLVLALQHSAEHTIQLWCRPWKTTNAVVENDSTRILNSLVDSGLPLPKSPSGRFPHSSSYEDDVSIQEREERGWWSFRFHQIMYKKRQMVSSTT